MEILKEHFWTSICLILGSVLTIVGTIRIFIATERFNRDLKYDSKKIISAQDSIKASQNLSAEDRKKIQGLVKKNESLLIKLKELESENRDLLQENRSLSLENREQSYIIKKTVTEEVDYIETNPSYDDRTKKMQIEYLNNFAVALTKVRVSLRIGNPDKDNPIKISIIQNDNIKNTKFYDNMASFQYNIIYGGSSDVPVSIDLSNFQKKNLYLKSTVTLKSGIQFIENIYISDYKKKPINYYIHHTLERNGQLQNYKETGKYFPKIKDGSADLRGF